FLRLLPNHFFADLLMQDFQFQHGGFVRSGLLLPGGHLVLVVLVHYRLCNRMTVHRGPDIWIGRALATCKRSEDESARRGEGADPGGALQGSSSWPARKFSGDGIRRSLHDDVQSVLHSLRKKQGNQVLVCPFQYCRSSPGRDASSPALLPRKCLPLGSSCRVHVIPGRPVFQPFCAFDGLLRSSYSYHLRRYWPRDVGATAGLAGVELLSGGGTSPAPRMARSITDQSMDCESAPVARSPLMNIVGVPSIPSASPCCMEERITASSCLVMHACSLSMSTLLRFPSARVKSSTFFSLAATFC